MKKLLIAICLMLGFASFSLAQKKSAVTKTPVTKTGTHIIDSAAHLKANGTPDKRFKENKLVKPTGPLTKAGKPDMRYNANKTNTTSKSNFSPDEKTGKGKPKPAALTNNENKTPRVPNSKSKGN
jgi:hypothetical protein